jgi:hypothetical protein
MVIQQRSRHTRARGDALHVNIFIWPFREHRGCGVEQLFASVLRLQPASGRLVNWPRASALETSNAAGFERFRTHGFTSSFYSLNDHSIR